ASGWKWSDSDPESTLTKMESDPDGLRTRRLAFLFPGNKLGVRAVRSEGMRIPLVRPSSLRGTGLAAPERRVQPGALARARFKRCRGRRAGRLRARAQIRRITARERRAGLVPDNRAPRVL